MNKICTSIEQSKKLIELGIDRKTSDMYYWCGEDLRIGGYRAQDKDYDIPAWSVTALLDLLPPYLFEWERGIDLNIYPNLKGKGWHCSYMPNNIYDMQKDKFRKITSNDNLLDAAYEMIVWVLENNSINNI